MKVSGKDVLRSISDYFSLNSDSGNEVIWILIIIVIFIFAAIIVQQIVNKYRKIPQKSRLENLPEQDMELLKQISAQKGISSSERDFLLTIALNYGIKPVKILLDLNTFEKIEKKLEDKAIKAGIAPSSDEQLANLRNLKNRLFL